jgi:NADH-quinone oxidoreductase subunit J
MTVAEGVFYQLGGLAIASAVLVISSRNPVASLLFTVLAFFCLAGLFVTLEAHFIAAIQILIYAGAILVLFLFVIMLLNLDVETHREWLAAPPVLIGSTAMGAAFLLILFFLWRRGALPAIAPAAPAAAAPAPVVGYTEGVGVALYTDFLLPFEVTSLLLLVAMVGAVMLAKRQR